MITSLKGRGFVRSISNLAVLLVSMGSCEPLFCMERTDDASITLDRLPDLVWNKIIKKLTEDITCGSNPSDVDHETIKKSALKCLYCIRRILPLRRLCKQMNTVISDRVTRYCSQAGRYIEQLGGPDSLLYSQIIESESGYHKELARLCIMLGARLNKRGYTSDNVVAEHFRNQETMLTLAIFQNHSDAVARLLALGADPIQPNGKWEIPMDLAMTVCPQTPLYIARLLKENGGDPDDFYSYYGQFDVIKKGRSYGTTRGRSLLEQKTREVPPTNPFYRREEPSTASTPHTQ